MDNNNNYWKELGKLLELQPLKTYIEPGAQYATPKGEYFNTIKGRLQINNEITLSFIMPINEKEKNYSVVYRIYKDNEKIEENILPIEELIKRMKDKKGLSPMMEHK